MSDISNIGTYTGGNCYAEIWENQVYWPITGWEAQKNCQYSDLYYQHGQSKDFPVLELPHGWDWDGDWKIDHSKRYGETDSQGYCYGSTNARVLDKIIGCCSTDAPTASSMIRRRCWVRTKMCVNDAAQEEWRRQLIGCTNTKHRLEANIQEKIAEWSYINEFENRRGYMYAVISQRCTNSCTFHLGHVKTIHARLLLLRSFLNERSQAEREFARRLELAAAKYISTDTEGMVLNTGTSTSTSTSGGGVGSGGNGLPDSATPAATDDADNDSFRHCKILDQLDAWDHGNRYRQMSANTFTGSPGTTATPSVLSTGFFNGLSTATGAISERSQYFSILVADGMMQDVTNLINLINNVLKLYTAELKRLNDNYQAADEAVQRSLQHIQNCFDIQQQLLKERVRRSIFAYKVAAEQGGGHYFWKAGARRTLSKSSSSNSFYGQNSLLQLQGQQQQHQQQQQGALGRSPGHSRNHSRNFSGDAVAAGPAVGVRFGLDVVAEDDDHADTAVTTGTSYGTAGIDQGGSGHGRCRSDSSSGSEDDCVICNKDDEEEEEGPTMSSFAVMMGRTRKNTVTTPELEEAAALALTKHQHQHSPSHPSSSFVLSSRTTGGSMSPQTDSGKQRTNSAEVGSKSRGGSSSGSSGSSGGFSLASWKNSLSESFAELVGTSSSSNNSNSSNSHASSKSVAITPANTAVADTASTTGRKRGAGSGSGSGSGSSSDGAINAAYIGSGTGSVSRQLSSSSSRKDSFMHFGEESAAPGSPGSTGPGVGSGSTASTLSNMTSSDGSNSSNVYSDMWLGIQMYRNGVLKHTEALQELMEFQSDQVLLFKNLMSKAHHVFIASMKLLTFEQCRLWTETMDVLEETCIAVLSHSSSSSSDMSASVSAAADSDAKNGSDSASAVVVAAAPASQSLSVQASVSITSPARVRVNNSEEGGENNSREGGGDANMSPAPSAPASSALLGRAQASPSPPMFPVLRRPLSSKTVDFWLQDSLSLPSLPNSAAVVMHGILAVAYCSDLARCSDLAEVEALWEYRHVTVTMDGYIYVCAMGRSGTPVLPPLQSFDASRCEFAHGVSGYGPIPHSIELRHRSKTSSRDISDGGVIIGPDGAGSSGSSGSSASAATATACVIKTNDAEEALAWVTVMENPLSTDRDAPGGIVGIVSSAVTDTTVTAGAGATTQKTGLQQTPYTSAASGVPTPPEGPSLKGQLEQHQPTFPSMPLPLSVPFSACTASDHPSSSTSTDDHTQQQQCTPSDHPSSSMSLVSADTDKEGTHKDTHGHEQQQRQVLVSEHASELPLQDDAGDDDGDEESPFSVLDVCVERASQESMLAAEAAAAEAEAEAEKEVGGSGGSGGVDSDNGTTIAVVSADAAAFSYRLAALSTAITTTTTDSSSTQQQLKQNHDKGTAGAAAAGDSGYSGRTNWNRSSIGAGRTTPPPSAWWDMAPPTRPDPNTRISTRRGSKIEQYEKGLRESFNQYDTRVKETRQNTLEAFQIDPEREPSTDGGRVSLYEKGLRESFNQYDTRVKETRQNTLKAFQIRADGSSCCSYTPALEEGGNSGEGVDGGEGEELQTDSTTAGATGIVIKPARRLSSVKALASAFDKP